MGIVVFWYLEKPADVLQVVHMLIHVQISSLGLQTSNYAQQMNRVCHVHLKDAHVNYTKLCLTHHLHKKLISSVTCWIS